jgi:DNA-binding MarR family transcriptional regulator
LLTLTAEGEALLEEVQPAMIRAQLRMLEPLPEPDRARFMQMLKVLVGHVGSDAGGPQGEANDASS